MKFKQVTLTDNFDSSDIIKGIQEIEPSIFLIFGNVEKCILKKDFFKELSNSFPNTKMIGCTTAGEISNSGISEESIVINAIQFEKVKIKAESNVILKMEDSENSGKELAKKLNSPDLKSLFVIGQGVKINGSSFIKGLVSNLNDSVILTGGLAADNGKFEQTFVIYEGEVRSDINVALGFYGESVGISHGSFGGWQSFGPSRLVTKSEGNVLYELDDKPALELYKTYLGEYAKDLPTSALLYPLALLNKNHEEEGLIRTILGINETESSMTLAGDIPEGSFVKLMHSNTNLLVEGAEKAATQVLQKIQSTDSNSLTILVSCVGRKLIMGERTEEEIEAVRSMIGEKSLISGFYSNGEISPFITSTNCKLHNQTMTITYIYEKDI